MWANLLNATYTSVDGWSGDLTARIGPESNGEAYAPAVDPTIIERLFATRVSQSACLRTRKTFSKVHTPDSKSILKEHKKARRLGGGVTQVEGVQKQCKYTVDIKWMSKKVRLGTFEPLEKAKEIHDLFVFQRAGRDSKKLTLRLTNRSWQHYFSNEQLHLQKENLLTTWEKRYSAYDKNRIKCFVSRYQSHQENFITLNKSRVDYNLQRKPYPLYYTQLGISRESLKLCEAIKAQLARFDFERNLLVVPELHLVAHTCVVCKASFVVPNHPELCGTQDLMVQCQAHRGAN
jgi:hypothetical protein